MSLGSIWISGPTRSGKTSRLLKQLSAWMAEIPAGFHSAQSSSDRTRAGTFLVFAANGENRLTLADQISELTRGKFGITTTTPLGFFQDEVLLFWPLLVQQLSLKAHFPLRLRPETEQELARQLWSLELEQGLLHIAGVRESAIVRRVLDLLQLAATSGIPTEKIGTLLEQGLGINGADSDSAMNWSGLVSAEFPEIATELLLKWRNWCLERGFLSYSIIAELYGRHLLPHPVYQQQLHQRIAGVLADDVDDYPAIARSLFEVLLDLEIPCAFTYHPGGAVRLGLNADPEYLWGLQRRCQQIETYEESPGLAAKIGLAVIESIQDPSAIAALKTPFPSIKTTYRSDLLRNTAQAIIEIVKTQNIQPREIAVIAPGLDAIARYTLSEILTKHQIPVEFLKDQRPLVASPIIRAILTLLTLIYGLGRLVDRDAVAEMLSLLSYPTIATPEPTSPHIDLVRAGLLADHCFEPHPDQPRLLPLLAFPRWDRLGYQAAAAYEGILQWIEATKITTTTTPAVEILQQAIGRFFLKYNHLSSDRLAELRELTETAQHYWEVEQRMQEQQTRMRSQPDTISEFIQLLRQGTITANPYPVRPIGLLSNAVTLATIFQYRASRRAHPWQFWLDAGSPLWLSGGTATLFAAPFFLRGRLGQPWTQADALQADQDRLQRILLDLLARADTKVILCHSDLAVNGQEQNGPLLPLLNVSIPFS